MRIGIDLGGTKIEGGLLGDDGAVLLRERRATPRGDYEGTLGVIGAIVRGLGARAGGRSRREFFRPFTATRAVCEERRGYGEMTARYRCLRRRAMLFLSVLYSLESNKRGAL